ncbi:MAG: 7,8-didemethyl-8-hydroxy-5-deazariboflavin synthase subunit CofG [Candidatus Hydrothermarchaeales archaeon]
MRAKEISLELLEQPEAQFSEIISMALPRRVTYSKNVFIPLTNACRNRCSYCGFRSDKPMIMSRRQVKDVLTSGRKEGCKEALFTFGEKPESVKEIKTKLKSWGYSSAIEYLYDLCEDALALGLLPHSNPGVMNYGEMKALKEVNASLGLMLENSSARLCQEGMPHEFSPGKRPEVRIKVLEDAGKLRIPFTTGLLIGIGETDSEIADSLSTLSNLQEKHGHTQEVIIQNFRPHRGTPMQDKQGPSLLRMLKVVAAARAVLPDIGLQVPPNLNRMWQVFLLFGANDLGGVSPVTKDYINPEYDWPKIEAVKAVAAEMGVSLKERLPIYPKYIRQGWYATRLGELIERYADEEGLVHEVSEGLS